MLFKEIGHIAFRVRNYEEMQKFYKENFAVTKTFCMENADGEERIGYYGLPDGHFIELFPMQKANPHGFTGDNARERHSFQYGWLCERDTKFDKLAVDPEKNTWKINADEKKCAEGLYGATFYCRKYEEMKKFYTDLLEFPIAEETAHSCCLELKSGQFIELIEGDYTQDNRTVDKAHHHVALLTDDIEKAAEKLEADQILLSHGTKLKNPVFTKPYCELKKIGSDGSYAFYFSDPEGNDLEAMQYTEKSMQIKYSQKNKEKE